MPTLPADRSLTNCTYYPKPRHIKKAEKIKASVRTKVEHAFFYIKRMFGYRKIRYRGLAKNTNRLYVLSGLANLLRCQKYLLA
ncbi:transposase [Microbulbifer thermotolerans]